MLAWFGVIAPVLRLGLILVLGSLHPTYSQRRDFISELGAPDSPYAPLMNVGGIALVGVFLLLFSLPLRQFQPRGSGATVGALLLAVSGAAFVAVGLLPCDQPGCSPESPSATMQAHLFAGSVAMATQTLAALAFGFRLFTRAGPRWYAGVSFSLGMIAILALGFLFGTGLQHPLAGLAQKIMQASADIWVLVSACYTLQLQRARRVVSRG